MTSILSVPAPSSGEELAVASEAGAKLNLGFDPANATVSRTDNDLVFELDGGGRVTLSDFFEVGDKELPSLVLPDGTEIASADYLTNFDIELSTAAGPGAGTGTAGSGAGEYVDDAGSLVDGVSRLGSLGTIYWDRETEVPEQYTDPLTADAFIPSISITPMLPGTPQTPDQPSTPDNPVHYLDASGYNLKVDESYMEGGTNYTGGGNPSYTVEFLVTTNDGLASVTIDGVTYPVENGTLVGFSSADGANGSLSNAVLVDNGDGTYTLSFTYTQGTAHTHEADGKDTADNVDSFTIGVTSDSGQTDSATVNVDIVDDVPVIRAAEDAPALAATVDESPLGNTYKDGKLTAELSAEDVQAQFDVNFGADGEGSSSYSLNLNTGGADSIGSGLYAVAEGGGKGDEIMLSQEGNVITGKTADGTVYFTLTADPETGKITLTLNDNIWHSEKGGTAEAHNDAEVLHLDDGVLTLVKTVTDGDGDSASASIDLGANDVFSFNDDGPMAGNDVNSIAEGGQTNSVSGNVLENDLSGADGWHDNPVELQGGSEGKYGTLVLNPDGSYTYTRNGASVPDSGGTDVFTYRVYDADGDWSEATLTITVTNTAPTANDPTGTELTVALEDKLAAGDDKDTKTETYDMFDGPEDFTDAVFTSNPPSLEGGESLTWVLSQDGKTWTGSDGNGKPIVTVTLDSIAADGTVSITATLNDPASHDKGSDSIVISGITVKATDEGGSTAEGKVTVTIADHAPTAGNGEAQVSESYINESLGWNKTGSGKDDDDSFPNSASYEGKLELDYGADGPAAENAFVWNLPDTTSENSPFSSLEAMVNGKWESVTWEVSADSKTLIGKAGGHAVIEVGMDPETGKYTVNIHTGLKHDAPDTGNDYDYNTDFGQNDVNTSTPLEFDYTVTDADGDSAAGTVSVTVQDDVLELNTPAGEVVWVEEGGEADLSDFFTFDDTISLGNNVDLDNLESLGNANGFKISAGVVSIDADGNVTFEDGMNATLNPHGNGLGVSSDLDKGMDPTTRPGDRTDQLNYVKTGENGEGYSEAIIIDLDGLAFGINLDVRNLQMEGNGDNANEYFTILFYKSITDAEGNIIGYDLVESKTYTADDLTKTGASSATLDSIIGGFDRVVIIGADNGLAASGDNGYVDNSDFFLHSVSFTTIGDDAVAYYEGKANEAVTANGADGVANIAFDADMNGKTIATGEGTITLKVNETGTHVVGTLPDGTVAFEAYLTSSTGEWVYVQYVDFDFDGDRVIELGIVATDNDGDRTTGSITVKVPEAPQSPVDPFDQTVTVDESFIPGQGSFDQTNEGGALSHQAEGSFTLAEGALAGLTVNGMPVYDGAEITTQYGILTFTITVKDGVATIEYVYTLTNAYNHTPDTGPDQLAKNAESLEFKSGDTPVGTVTVGIEDDAPVITTTDGVFQNAEGTVVQGELAEYGADGAGSIVFTNLEEAEAACTWQYDGQSISLKYADGTHTVVNGYGHDGTLLFTLVANQETGEYTYTQIVPIDSTKTTVIGSGTLTEKLPGNHTGGVWIDDTDSGGGILATEPADGTWALKIDMFNNDGSAASANGNTPTFGLNGGQLKDGYAVVTPYTDLNTDTYATNLVIGVLGNNSDVPADGMVTATVTYISLTTGDIVTETYTNVGNSITVPDMEGYYIGSAKVETDDPKVGLTGAGSSKTVYEDIVLDDLEIDYVVTDSDGDSASGSLTLSPETTDDITAPDDAGYALAGGDGGNTITGGAGNDILSGGDGDDILFGGAGSDVMYGGDGADTFIWLAADRDGSLDKVMDFRFSDMDKLNLDGLFATDRLTVDDLLETFDVTIDADAGTVTLSAKDESLNVEVHVQDNELQTFIDAHGDSGSAETQAALLTQMVQNVTG